MTSIFETDYNYNIYCSLQYSFEMVDLKVLGLHTLMYELDLVKYKLHVEDFVP